MQLRQIPQRFSQNAWLRHMLNQSNYGPPNTNDMEYPNATLHMTKRAGAVEIESLAPDLSNQ